MGSEMCIRDRHGTSHEVQAHWASYGGVLNCAFSTAIVTTQVQRRVDAAKEAKKTVDIYFPMLIQRLGLLYIYFTMLIKRLGLLYIYFPMLIQRLSLLYIYFTMLIKRLGLLYIYFTMLIKRE